MVFKGILPNNGEVLKKLILANFYIYILLILQPFHKSIYIAGMASHLIAVEYGLYIEEKYIRGHCVACSI